MPRDRVGARLAGLLIHAVMRIGRKRAALPGFEVHDVLADRAALQLARRLPGFVEQRQIHAERALAASVPAIDWNTRSTGAPRRIASICVVTCASTQLCVGISIALAHAVEHAQEEPRPCPRCRSRIDADHGVAAAEHQAVENAGRDARADRRWDDWAAGA